MSWAARVLLWLITRAGFCVSLITLAAVKVLPDPVTPNSVCLGSPEIMPFVRP